MFYFNLYPTVFLRLWLTGLSYCVYELGVDSLGALIGLGVGGTVYIQCISAAIAKAPIM